LTMQHYPFSGGQYWGCNFTLSKTLTAALKLKKKKPSLRLGFF
jgi:hypothetical protein